jgi:hypothetical protein
MPYLGSTPNASFSSRTKQDFTANGSTTAFTLSSAVASANDIEVFVGNVRQEPTEAYTVNGTTLTMSAAPANGLNFYVVFKGVEENSVVPADGTISDAKIVGMTSSKLTGTVSSARLPAGSVLQVVSSTLSSAFSTSNYSSFVDFLSATITPSSTSSKILVTVHVGGCGHNVAASRTAAFQLKRGATPIGIGDVASNRMRGSFRVQTSTDSNHARTGSMSFLDSPSTASAVTYNCGAMAQTNTLFINKTGTDTDLGGSGQNYGTRVISTITLTEIAG